MSMLELFRTANADDAFQNLRLRLIATLAAIGILILFALLVLQWQLAGHRHDTHVIEVARNQTTLVERLVKSSHRLAGVGTPALRRSALEELSDALATLQRNHTALQHGNDSLALPGGNSARVQQLFGDLEHAYVALVAAAAKIVAAPDSQGELYQARQRLDDNAPGFVAGMNAIVTTYQAESESRVAWMRGLALVLALATLALAAVAARFVVEPALDGLRQRLDQQRDSHADMEGLVDACPIALLVVDAVSLGIVRANQTAAELFDCPADDIAGRPLSGHFDIGLEINRRFLGLARSGERFDNRPVLFVDVRNKATDARATLRKVRYDGRDHYLVSIVPTA